MRGLPFDGRWDALPAAFGFGFARQASISPRAFMPSQRPAVTFFPWLTNKSPSPRNPSAITLKQVRPGRRTKKTPAEQIQQALGKSCGNFRGSRPTRDNQPQVRFLWRFARERFLRLCCEILRRRFLRRFPITKSGLWTCGKTAIK